jgi:hypothetical protein
MKRNILKLFALLFITIIVVVFSCTKKEYDVPPSMPVANLEKNKSIKSLIAGYEGGVDTIKEDWIIKGIVTANDESGNFYKTLYIQDDSSAINIQIDRSNMYRTFAVGQKVYIKCKGLALGNYGGMIQIGYPYYDAGSLTVGRIPDIFVDEHIFRDSFPGNPPAPKIIPAFNKLTSADLGLLIKFPKVSFETPCELYATDFATTNNNVIDTTGTMMQLRTSNYANFRANYLPDSTGSLTGIYSIYNGAGQFYIRDLNDVDFAKPCATVLLVNEGFATATLGTFKQYSVKGNAVWEPGSYSGKYYAQITSYYTYDYNEDWLISPSFNLDGYSDETLIFESATKYGTPTNTLKLFWSKNYSGTGNPNDATWTEITGFSLSTGNFTWVSSGPVNLSDENIYNGSKVYFAFKFESAASTSPTWEITNIRLRGKKK